MKEETPNQHFRNLLSIALADGILDKSELDFIFKKSGKYFITEDEFLSAADNSIIEPGLIEDSIERSEKMLDLIEMMLLDGETHDNERRLCIMFGVSLGYSANNIETLVDSSTKMLEAGDKTKKILKTIQTFK